MEHVSTLGKSDIPVHVVIGELAARNPHSVALRHQGAATTYGDLDSRAGTLAQRLVAQGVGREDVVAVYLPRGADVLTAWLGVLRSGAAYLPLDPNAPPDRISTALSGSGAALVVTDSTGATGLPTGTAVCLLTAADDDPPPRTPPTPGIGPVPDLVPLPDVPPLPDVVPEQLAYLVFTSGSTGRPKPVAVAHRSLAHHAAEVGSAYGLTEHDRVLQFAGLGFDVAAEETFPTWTHGGEVVVVHDQSITPVELEAFLDANKVTVANLPTPVWEQWVADLNRSPRALPASLRLMVIGSDKGRTAALADWRKHSDVPVINAYGLTETTITVTNRHFAAHEPLPTEAVLPIGFPLAGCEVHLLDELLAPVADGEIGELYLGGTALARGYHGRPDLTAERFVPAPGSPVPGARLYRTGDRARRLPDGDLAFLGRTDDQVKIRGHRVEPAEIEAALLAHPHIAQAHVAITPAGSEPGDEQPVGYVAPADGRRVPGAAELRRHLADRLPSYMLPRMYVILPELPLTAHGKIDRAALPALAVTRTAADYAAPRTPVEEELAGIWSEVLHLARIGIDDDFFELGGHSLLATQIVARARESFGTELAVRDLFAAPSVARLARRIAEERTDVLAMPPLHADPERVEGPLSVQQEQVWFLTAFAPGNIAYHAQTTMKVSGELRVDLLAAAATELVRRHPILRTTYHEVDGRPHQRIHGARPVEIPTVDLRDVPEGERGKHAEELIQDELVRPFDLGRLPLIRWTVLRLDEHEYEIILVEHHLVHDGWSFALLMRELKEIYAAALAGREHRLPEQSAGYLDYAVWQRRALEGPAFEAQLDFWRDRLAGLPPALELPTDRPRPARQSFRGEMLRVDLPAELAASVRAFSRKEQATLFMTLFAGYVAVLNRYTGQEDVALGSAFANRQQPGTEDLLGMIVNTVVLRCDLGGKPSFRELLARVRTVILDASAHQEYPFPELVRALNPKRDPGRNPFFQFMFSCNDSQLPELELGDSHATIYERDNGSAKMDMNVIVIPRAESQLAAEGSSDSRITLLWEYNADLFDRTTMQRFADHFLRLLADGLARPDEPVDRASLLGAREREQLLTGWNATEVDYPGTLLLHRMVEEQAARTPDATAVVHGGESLTYRELDRWANRIANRLREAGVGPETVVAVAAERSCELVAGLLGVLKSGGAYLPLDPSYPKNRLAYLLTDSRAGVLLVHDRVRDALPAFDQTVLPLDLATGASEQDPHVRVQPDHAAYVIYTSGSTGMPKGVVNSHRGIVNRLRWMQDAYRLGTEDRVLQKTPYSFDVSVWEFFWPLAQGAVLVSAEPEGHRDSRYLAETVRGHGITVMHFVPSMLRLFLTENAGDAGNAAAGIDNAGQPEGVSPWYDTLRLVISSGEELPFEVQEEFAAALPGVPLENLYGPTEAAVDVTRWTCLPGDPRGIVPIGFPIANTRVHILDHALEPTPVGIPGELHIGGVQVARGYHGRPGLTADRFVPDPFAGEPGTRLYRTGDLARRLTDGSVEFLGRLDSQVKLRGLRIELGEVEHALRTHCDVRDAVVLVDARRTGEPELVAHLTIGPDGEADPAVEDLRAHLRSTLPEHMVPALFIEHPDFPLNANGKTDRNAVSTRPGRTLGFTTGTGETPLDGTRRRIADLWQEVLGVERVDAHTTFFDLGGHSMLLTRVRHRIGEEFGITPSMTTLFAHPTVAALAAHLDGPGAGPDGDRDETDAERVRTLQSGRSRLSRRRTRRADTEGTDVR